MIYAPSPEFFVLQALTAGIVAALTRAAADYLTQSGQSWAYYIGYGIGGAALATGIPGANMIIATIGTGELKLFFEKSPGAGDVKIFLDGVEAATLNLTDAALDVFQYSISIPDDSSPHQVSVLNLGGGTANWLSILQIQTTGITIQEQEQPQMANFIISATIQDSAATGTARVRNTQGTSIFVPQASLTLADITAYHDAYLTALDAVTDGKIIGSSITLTPDLPSGLKSSAVANSDVQEGGLLGWSVDNTQYKDSFRVPAFLTAAFSGKSIDLANTYVVALKNLLLGVTQVNSKSIVASDKDSNEYNALITGAKSFRK